MTLNGRSEINKNSGAHQKNFNEDRPMSVVAKCRPMHLFVIYKVYADIRRGCIGGGGVKYNKCEVCGPLVCVLVSSVKVNNNNDSHNLG